MIDLSIIVPLGISSPGTPVIQYLKWCVQSLQNQTTNYNYKIIFACDDNVSDEVKDYLKSTQYDISWYDSYSFFRRGSVWKKIILEWQKVESKYVAFCHYDDVWSANKIQNQLDLMNLNNLDLSWSAVQIIDQHNIVRSGDVALRTTLTKDTIRMGQTYAFSHSTILSKDKFLNSGILDYLERSAPVYEGLHYIFCHKLNGMKDPTSIFYHRVHGYSVSNNLHTDTEEILNIKKMVNYSSAEALVDEKSIDFNAIINQIYR